MNMAWDLKFTQLKNLGQISFVAHIFPIVHPGPWYIYILNEKTECSKCSCTYIYDNIIFIHKKWHIEVYFQRLQCTCSKKKNILLNQTGHFKTDHNHLKVLIMIKRHYLLMLISQCGAWVLEMSLMRPTFFCIFDSSGNNVASWKLGGYKIAVITTQHVIMPCIKWGNYLISIC